MLASIVIDFMTILMKGPDITESRSVVDIQKSLDDFHRRTLSSPPNTTHCLPRYSLPKSSHSGFELEINGPHALAGTAMVEQNTVDPQDISQPGVDNVPLADSWYTKAELAQLAEPDTSDMLDILDNDDFGSPDVPDGTLDSPMDALDDLEMYGSTTSRRSLVDEEEEPWPTSTSLGNQYLLVLLLIHSSPHIKAQGRGNQQ